MNFIECINAGFCYSGSESPAVDNISFTVNEGEFVAVLGANGSGKSTLAKLLNSIFKPTYGKVIVCGLDSSDDNNIWNIRKNVGMVFQNPDNQIVAAVVEEDVAFGAENIGVPYDEIVPRVKYALDCVGMSDYAEKEPYLLSGGQKQRVAIAGILAMKPKCIIFDEATAMLDPIGRENIINIITDLNKKEKITVIIVTHFMSEALLADKVIVMEKGRIALNGTPKDVFSDAYKIKSLGLELPVAADIIYKLNQFGFNIDKDIVYDYEFVDFIVNKGFKNTEYKHTYNKIISNKNYNNKIMQVKNISFVYNEKSVSQKKALDNISFNIFKGEILAVIGKTGSGKSTLTQILNALIKPSEGDVLFHDNNIFKFSDIKSVRQKIGVVFQYPEYQFFEETVIKDAMFGPVNMGFSQDEAKEKVLNAFKSVGLDEEFFLKSPFELSGGQKRRAAIASVIAMCPEILILDEPTAGLDPSGRNDILKNILNTRRDSDMTIVLISHSMEEVCEIADRIIVMSDGKIALCGNREEVFSASQKIESFGIKPPSVTSIFRKIYDKGIAVPLDIYTVDDAVDFFKSLLVKNFEISP